VWTHFRDERKTTLSYLVLEVMSTRYASLLYYSSGQCCGMRGLAITIIMLLVQIAIQVLFVHVLFKYLFDYLLMFGMHSI
jgi:hypothetical protein